MEKKLVPSAFTILCLLLILGSHAVGGELEPGIRLYEQKKYDEAKKFFLAHLKTHKADDEVCSYLGKISFFEADLDASIDWFKQALEITPGVSDLHVWLGNAYGRKAMQSNPIKQAFLAPKIRGAYEKAIELDSTNTEARFNLLQYYALAPGIMGGSREKAVIQAEKIKALDVVQGHQAFGFIYNNEKKYDLAEKEYLAAIKQDSSNLDLYFQLSRWYRNLKKYEPALALFRKLEKRYPNDPNISLEIGYVYQELENFDQAFAAFEKIIMRDPQNANAYYQVGRTGAFSGQNPDRAAECLKKYLIMAHSPDDPSPAWAHYRLGMVYEKAGKIDSARSEYVTAVRLDENLKDAKTALKKLPQP